MTDRLNFKSAGAARKFSLPTLQRLAGQNGETLTAADLDYANEVTMLREPNIGVTTLESDLLAHAIESIAQRRRERRVQHLHDALLITGTAVSLSLASAGGALLWLMVHGAV